MHVLVTAASKHGSTAGIAELIGNVLTEQGLDATACAPGDVAGLDGYDGLSSGAP